MATERDLKGSQFTTGFNGARYLRRCRAFNLPVETDPFAQIENGLNDSQMPQFGHSITDPTTGTGATTFTALQVSNRTVDRVDCDRNSSPGQYTVWVTVEYSNVGRPDRAVPNDNGDGLIRLGQRATTEATQFKRNLATGQREQMIVRDSEDNDQAGVAQIIVGERFISFFRKEQTNPRSRADTFSNTRNQGLWNGYGEGQVLLLPFEGESRDGGASWDVQYEFLIQDEETLSFPTAGSVQQKPHGQVIVGTDR